MVENVTIDLVIGCVLAKKARIKQGALRYRRHNENKCVDVSKDYENYFNATVLEKVNTERHAGEGYPAKDEFYPALHAGIFGAVGVSQFPYHFNTNVWRAFCELWGPLTNTLRHGTGEVGISFYDLERIGGLPVLGAIYEKFLPPNIDLAYYNKFSATVVELLCIHAELCKFHNRKYVVYFAYGEQTDSQKGKVEAKKKSPLCITCQERMTILNVQLRQSYFLLSTIAAQIMAILVTFLVLFIMLAYLVVNFHSQVMHVFRNGRYLSLRVSSYHEDSCNGRDVIDMGLPDEDFKFLLSIRSSILPRRFARQFRLDQGIPSNRLSFVRALRQQMSIMDLAQAYADPQSCANEKPSVSSFEKEKPRDLSASKARAFQSLSALRSIIDIYKLSTIEIC
ncbi:hypothetical protein Cgig2_007513 [Carnegiea gigantea]|uniref:Uncharacterized protein n=1 Tax=Carnegiea gigantea TaxID=171969 RepID=A0A9Q1Q6N3_9CARY|nr:hypothetical protein Cgig2_007513 [Carnegiea gigantea]